MILWNGYLKQTKMKTHDWINIWIIAIITWIFILASNTGVVVNPYAENYVSPETVRINGSIYHCGTVYHNEDFKSLYCRGYAEGYDWAVRSSELN